MAKEQAAPSVIRHQEDQEFFPRMRAHFLHDYPQIRDAGEGWSGPLFGVWELERASWTDLHAHEELNFILAGELHVTSGGHTVIARTGDLVTTPPGQVGEYAAPKYARMISVYGPNPNGEYPPHNDTYRELD